MVGTSTGIVAACLTVAIVVATVVAFSAALHTAVCSPATEEIEVVDAVAQAEGPVFAYSLVDLCTCHRKGENACLAVLQFCGEVVLERHVDTEQRGKGLVDAHRRDVVHRAGNRIARRGVCDKAHTRSHESHECGVALVGADGEDALVAVVEVDTLEDIP